MKVKVIVTGAGGPAGVAVIRDLRASGVLVVAADADPLAVGLRLGDDYEVLPRADDDTLVDAICALADRTGADALISTVAEELILLATYESRLNRAGLKTWFPSPLAVERCIDKWHFAVAMQAAGIAVPRTGLGSIAGVPGPWIVKPRFGRGSRDVYEANERDEVELLVKRVPDAIVQTRLLGREFTVDALHERRRRRARRGGTAMAARDEGGHLDQGSDIHRRRAGRGRRPGPRASRTRGSGERPGVRR